MIRKQFAVLLLVAVVPLLVSIPAGNSQSFTTVTNVGTVTTQATFTQVSQYAVATTTETSAVSESIYDSSFVQKGVGRFFCYIGSPISFDAIQGQRVQGTIRGTIKDSLTMYLMSDTEMRRWASDSPRYCDPSESGHSYLLTASKVTSFTLDWTVPADGTYWLVLETYSDADSTITASIAKSYSTVIASTIYSTQTSLLLLTATQTVTSISTREIAAPGSIQGNNTLTFAGLGAIIVVALAAAYFVFSKRKQKKV